jgi:hypothetical protein
MKRNRIIVILCILFGLINLKTQCNKDYPAPPGYKYSFQEKVSVTPYQLNYHVGDTVTLQLTIPGKKLFDSKTNTRVLFDSASFNIGVVVNLIFNDPYIGDGPFASFIFRPGVSAYTQTYPGTTQSFITTGCSLSADYVLAVGVVLLQKGVFSLGIYNNDLKNCFTGSATSAQLSLSLDVDDTHKSFYHQLPFSSIGKIEDDNVLRSLDVKGLAIINVQ